MLISDLKNLSNFKSNDEEGVGHRCQIEFVQDERGQSAEIVIEKEIWDKIVTRFDYLHLEIDNPVT